MSFDGIKTLGAYDMFHTAGILGCCFGVNAQAYQPAGEELVTFIYFFCDFPAFRCKSDKSLGVNFDIAVDSEIFHGNADTGLGEVQFIGNINGAHM